MFYLKILVLAENYSKPDGSLSLHYIHTRKKRYVQNGIDVSVISFRAKNDYLLDGVKVYTLKTYKKKLVKRYYYDLLVSHAPNLKNHYKFLKKYSKHFDNIFFFFHGHEVLKTSEIYPEPYGFCKKNSGFFTIMRDIYDIVKLRIWRKYFEKIAYKSQFVFVSNWMYDMFIKFVGLDPEIISNRKHIIYNCIGEQFERNNYKVEKQKEYDFITIRNNLDGSKYGIDIVTRIAKNNPQYKFCVVGKGDFYKFNKKPQNIEWIDKHLSHEEIIDFLNKSKCALLPTRADAQGVMACEMATFGIPLITSNIDVCKEVFKEFENVAFIDNDKKDIDIKPIFNKLQNIKVKGKNKKYFAKNTVDKEIELFKTILS